MLQSLDWSRDRPTVAIVEDFAAFADGTRNGGSSAMRAFLLEHDYAVASQTVFSFLYVDRHAFEMPAPTTGFRLGGTQLTELRLPAPQAVG